MIYGIDVSAYQPYFDFAAARREGFDFAFIKATQGTGWKNPFYAAQLNRARAAGLLVAAYHYVDGNDVAGQLANVRSMVSTDLPVMLDVEKGAGTIQTIRQLNAGLNRVGYRTPLIYIPQWYHRDHMGSPDLRGLPPNWRSWYPDDVVRRKEDAVDAVPNYIWDELVGGIPTVVMQMTSSLAVANYPNGKIDGNAFRGTRDQLAALLGGTPPTEEDDVSAADVTQGLYDTRVDGRNLYDWALQIRAEQGVIRDQLMTELAGVRAALTLALERVGSNAGASAEELEAAVTKAIRENVVKVDVSVGGQPSA